MHNSSVLYSNRLLKESIKTYQHTYEKNKYIIKGVGGYVVLYTLYLKLSTIGHFLARSFVPP